MIKYQRSDKSCAACNSMEARGRPGKRQHTSIVVNQDVPFLPHCVTLCVIYVMHVFAAEVSTGKGAGK